MLAQITMNVEPIEVDGKHFVDVSMNGRQPKRYGPYADANTAKAKADKLIQHWQGTPNVPAIKNDIVVLHGKPVELTSDEGRRFVVDCVRAGEKLVSDSELQEEYGINPENWAKLEKNTALIKAVRDEGRRRVRTGQRAREAAQQHFTKVPTVLDKILSDERASPRHRIESAKELRMVVLGGNDTNDPAKSAELFHIVFNLGADHVEKIEKVIEHKPKQVEGEPDADERV